MSFRPFYRLMMSVAVLGLILYVCRRIYWTSRQTKDVSSALPAPDITFYDKYSKYCVCIVCMYVCTCLCVCVCVCVCGGGGVIS